MPCTTGLSMSEEDMCDSSNRQVISLCNKIMGENIDQQDDSGQPEEADQWKMEPVLIEKESEEEEELIVSRLLQSVSEVQNDYQNLRRELVEVQALQRELSDRLRTTLAHVHGKFESLKERIAGAPPH